MILRARPRWSAAALILALALIYAIAASDMAAAAAESLAQSCPDSAVESCSAEDDTPLKTEAVTFDAFGAWFDGAIEGARQDAKKLLQDIVAPKQEENQVLKSMIDGAKRGLTDLFDDGGTNEKGQQSPNSLEGVFGLLASLGRAAAKAGTGSEDSVLHLVERAKEIADGQSEYEARTLRQTLELFRAAFAAVHQSVQSSFGDLDLLKFNVFSFLYYLEVEDTRRTPSWKRRTHRFFRSVLVDEAVALHESLYLAELPYVDTVDEVRNGLRGSDWELVYASMEGLPAEPGHFLALKKRQSEKSKYLEVLLSVRGTKEVGDLLSDAFLIAESYRGGKAHVGVRLAGKYLVAKHTPLLRQLLELSGKSKIKLSLVGHSLGAGAAAIATIEFNDLDFIEASSIGFGCPALLTKELADRDDIVTVVSDADVVPRMSGATVRNAILDVMALDWADLAIRDVRQLISMMKENIPMPISQELERTVISFVERSLRESIKLAQELIPTERLEPMLIPPGKCIHFFRDGVSVSARHTPCSYFDSVEISRTLIDDHMTNTGYHKVMLNFVRDSKNDMHFKFAHDSLF